MPILDHIATNSSVQVALVFSATVLLLVLIILVHIRTMR